jgi:hypothetical protein
MIGTNFKGMKEIEKEENESDAVDELSHHQPHVAPIKKEDIALFSMTRRKWYLDCRKALHTLFKKHWCLPHPPDTFYFLLIFIFMQISNCPLVDQTITK